MNRLIVSFTSYPERISTVNCVLNSLYAQTRKADEIILWLAKEQFPNREADLPISLQDDLDAGRFTLRWCDNIGSHKKYFYVMQEYPEDIIVTVDDDTFYDPDTLQSLMDTHVCFPHAVVARTTSLVLFDSDFTPAPISEWLFDFQVFTEPSMILMAIGVGGVLYPPHSVSEKIFDKDFILDTCTVKGRTFGDDLLLKAGEMLNKTPVVTVQSKPYCRLPNTQETALAKLMPNEKHKDQLIKKYVAQFKEFFDNNSAEDLKSTVADFEESDTRLGLRKNYWLTRPSRDLERQLRYLSLCDAPSIPNASDYKKIEEIAHFSAKVFTAFPSGTSGDETSDAISAFRQQLLAIPGIEDNSKTDAALLGITKYGVPLNTACDIVYHGIPVYLQNLKNWQSFMITHPQCELIIRQGFKTYLKNTESKMNQAETVLSSSEIKDWKREYYKAAKLHRELEHESENGYGIMRIIRKTVRLKIILKAKNIKELFECRKNQ